MTGKAVTALLSFSYFVLLVRMLPKEGYAAYAASLALLETVLALSTFGLDWVAAMYVPQYREQGSPRQLRNFVSRLICIQIFVLGALGTGAALVAGFVSRAYGNVLPEQLVVLAAAWIFLEGTGRLFRDEMLGILLLQGWAQIAQILRIGSVLAFVFFWAYFAQASLDVRTVILVEACAAGLAALVGAGVLVRVLTRGTRAQPKSAWIPPPVSSMRALATHSYMSYLLWLTYSPQVLTALIARFLGTESTALYGFARALTDQVKRVIPVDLFMSSARPMMAAHYASDRRFADLGAAAQLLFKLNLLCIGLGLAIFIAAPEVILAAIGGGKFNEGGTVIVIMLVALIPYSHRRVIEMTANIVERSHACLRASALLCLTPVLSAAVLGGGGTLPAVLSIAAVAEVLFSIVTVRLLSNEGFRYKFDFNSPAVILALAALATLALLPWYSSASTLSQLVAPACVTTTLYLGAIAWLRPFSTSDVRTFKAFRTTP